MPYSNKELEKAYMSSKLARTRIRQQEARARSGGVIMLDSLAQTSEKNAGKHYATIFCDCIYPEGDVL